jgi:hypothetical protein
MPDRPKRNPVFWGIPGFWDAEIMARPIAWAIVNLSKELVETLVSQNEPESAAKVVRDCP